MLEIDESLLQTEPDSIQGLGNSSIILRQPRRADLDMLVALATKPVLAKNICCNWLPTSRAEAEQWLAEIEANAKHETVPFVMTDNKGAFVGAIGLLINKTGSEAEISVMIREAYWDKNYATQAIQAIADFAFSNPNKDQPSLRTVTARCRVTCGASRRVVEKCGFQYCGTGMAHSRHYDGKIPIDRYRLDRGIWHALRHWAGASAFTHAPKRFETLTIKGAA